MSKLRIKIITFNLGENRRNQDSWYADIFKSWDIVKDRDYDILGVCLQEDWNGNNGKLGEAIAAYLVNDYVMLNEVVEGPPDVSGEHFSIKVFIYIKSSLKILKQKKAKVCLKQQLVKFCSKGTAGIGFNLALGGQKILQIIIMSSHLPMDSKVADLGYAKRLKAVDKSFHEVYEKLVDKSVQQRLSIWGGDLNFRSHTPIDQNGAPVEEQLKYALSTNAQLFGGFGEYDVRFPPTCKLKTCHNKDCPICRKKSGDVGEPACYATDTKKGPRPPSYCDRILFKAEAVNMKLIAYKSWGASDAVQTSDHNLVYGIIELTI